VLTEHLAGQLAAEVLQGYQFESPDISARAVMGMALILALESHHTKTFDRDRAVSLISQDTVKGFFPTIQPSRRRR
jgi:hypothetical protein